MVLAALALPALSWVLFSPYPRGQANLGYSNRLLGDASRDWGPNTSFGFGDFSLHTIVLQWGAEPGFGSAGLGKSITYAIHPDFCNELLPRFPEDGARGGHLDGQLFSLAAAAASQL